MPAALGSMRLPIQRPSILAPSPHLAMARCAWKCILIDYHEALYGEPLEVDFLARLRDIRPFASPAELVQQLAQDVEQAKRIANA